MKIRWTKGLNKQLASDIREGYKEALVLRRRLSQMLLDIIEEKRKVQVTESFYDNPNWAYLQADKAGYERALRDVLELISEEN